MVELYLNPVSANRPCLPAPVAKQVRQLLGKIEKPGDRAHLQRVKGDSDTSRVPQMPATSLQGSRPSPATL